MDRPEYDLAALDQVRVGAGSYPDAGALVGPLQEGRPSRDSRGSVRITCPRGTPDWGVEGTCYAAIANGEIDLVSHAVDEWTGHAPMAFTGL
jgi:hypothetical protein